MRSRRDLEMPMTPSKTPPQFPTHSIKSVTVKFRADGSVEEVIIDYW